MMEYLTQKVQKIAGSLVLAGSLVALAGCDENKEVLLLETPIESCGRIKLMREVRSGNFDYYVLNVYDCDKNLKANVKFGDGTGIYDDVLIVHEGDTYTLDGFNK